MCTRSILERAVLPLMVAAALFPTGYSSADDETTPELATAAEQEPEESARSRDRNWRLRFFGAVTSDTGGSTVAVGHSYTGVAIGGGGGVGVNFEYRTSPRMGVEIGAMAVGGHVRVGAGMLSRWHGASVEVNGYVPVTFALNYHPLRNSEIVDIYVGPLVASTFLSTAGVGPGVAVESRVDFGLGANLGADINFGRKSRWSFSTGFKYISNVTDGGALEHRVDVDPLIFSFGFGFRF